MRVFCTRLVVATTLCLALYSSAAGAATVTNGGFEAGTTDGWTSLTTPGGVFDTYTTTSKPTYPASTGTYAAYSDQFEGSYGVLYQDVSLEAGLSHTLSLNYWAIGSNWNPYPSGETDLTAVPALQQMGRIDVVKASASPTTLSAADVLATVYAPESTSPELVPWTPASVDLSAFAGQTVRVRLVFSVIDAPNILGLDDVAVASKDTTSPLLTAFSTTGTTYRQGAKNAGFKTNFTSSEAGTAKTTFAKRTVGRKSGANCVKKTTKNSAAKKCNYWAALKGSLTRPITAGANTIRFTGKLNGKQLKAGKYKATIQVTDAAGNAATPVTVRFTVKPKKIAK